jgi:rubrerythrin
MKDAQTGIIEAVKYSIQMELDGKKFYLLSQQRSQSKIGNELFGWLAAQEDEHRKRFEQIYAALMAKTGWPVLNVKPDKDATFRTLFAEATLNAQSRTKQLEGDVAAADEAIKIEIKSRDFYADRAAKAASEAEKAFFKAVSAEEQGHYLALIDYKEYIADPVGFFTRTEHHSIDGQ